MTRNWREANLHQPQHQQTTSVYQKEFGSKQRKRCWTAFGTRRFK